MSEAIQRTVEEAVLILHDKSGEPVGMMRRDANNHGRVRVFTIQTAGWDDVKAVLKDVTGDV